MIEDKIEYIVMLIAAFAKRYHLSLREAYRYIATYKGIEMCERHYNIMHTLSLEDGVDGLASYCRRKGGTL